MTAIGFDQNSARQKTAASSPWQVCQHPDAAALVTLNLLDLASMNVLSPPPPDSIRIYHSEERRDVADRRRLTRVQRRLANLKKQIGK